MFHCLDDDGKRSYAAALHRATRPGARLLSCFSDANAADHQWPLPVVSGQLLRDVFGGAGWEIMSIEPTTLQRADGPEMAFFLVEAQRR